MVDWLRRGLGLPDAFDGLLTDTASTSSLIALGLILFVITFFVLACARYLLMRIERRIG